MKTFEKTTLLDCDIEKLFDFHLDMKNLKVITPLNTKVELVNKDFIPHEGGVIKIKTVKNFIPTTWEVKIEKLDSPNILVDVAIKSPFKYWKHSHVFTKKGSMCELKDIVEYKLPFGKIGELFDFFIQKELKDMFNFRHRITKGLLEERKI
jgi:ligand-binding SRPBCC domain-containing protein